MSNPIDSFVTSDLRTDWPEEVGFWWFYGYRYGKGVVGREHQPELMFCEVIEISNGLIVKADGQFMYKNEVEEPNFIPATLPELINL